MSLYDNIFDCVSLLLFIGVTANILLLCYFKYLNFLIENINSTVRTYINMFLVFVVSGLWHGANWTFILWGVLHGLICVLWIFRRKNEQYKMTDCIHCYICRFVD